MLLGDSLQVIVINLLCFARYSVVSDFIADAGEIHWMTVGEMATMRKVHAQNLIAILNRSQIHGHVCLRTAMRLHVGVLRPEYLFGSIDRSLLDDIRPLA